MLKKDSNEDSKRALVAFYNALINDQVFGRDSMMSQIELLVKYDKLNTLAFLKNPKGKESKTINKFLSPEEMQQAITLCKEANLFVETAFL